VIPAGVGHCNSGFRDDFLVVGSYLRGQSWACAPTAPVNVPRSSKASAEYRYPGQTAVSVSRGRWPNPRWASSSRRS
jgi:uncharacterized protein YjlB